MYIVNDQNACVVVGEGGASDVLTHTSHRTKHYTLPHQLIHIHLTRNILSSLEEKRNRAIRKSDSFR